METINILIIGIAVAFILLLWVIVGLRHLKILRQNILDEWENVDERLRKRQSLIPNLIETVRVFDQAKENLIEDLIAQRIKTAKEYNPGGAKMEFENELSMMIKSLLDLAKNNQEMATDTNFLELKTEFEDINQSAEERSKKYNEMVRIYNRQRNKLYLRPLAAIGKFDTMNIFEYE